MSHPCNDTKMFNSHQDNQSDSDSDSEFVDALASAHIGDSSIVKDINKALEAKELGNSHFREKNYDRAIQEYSNAIAYCPLDDESKENLSTFFGNRAAAYALVSEHALVVEDCTKSLSLKPNYVKVLARRMQSREKLEGYDESLQDAKEILTIDPNYPKINETIKRLERLNEEKMSRLKDEAMGKLKELGNNILGNFGMSLDNFKMNQDPVTGGWNISMNK